MNTEYSKPENSRSKSVCVSTADKKVTIIGIFEGYGTNGTLSAQTCKNIVLSLIKDERYYGQTLDQWKNYMNVLFTHMHTTILKKIKDKDSGTTALLIVYSKFHENPFIVFANAGDLEAYYIFKDGMIPLFSHHKPTEKTEYDRINTFNPKVSLNYVAYHENTSLKYIPIYDKQDQLIPIVDGKINKYRLIPSNARNEPKAYCVAPNGRYLKTTRALGDTYMHGLGITYEPSIGGYYILENEWHIIAASSGVWDNWQDDVFFRYVCDRALTAQNIVDGTIKRQVYENDTYSVSVFSDVHKTYKEYNYNLPNNLVLNDFIHFIIDRQKYRPPLKLTTHTSSPANQLYINSGGITKTSIYKVHLNFNYMYIEDVLEMILKHAKSLYTTDYPILCKIARDKPLSVGTGQSPFVINKSITSTKFALNEFYHRFKTPYSLKNADEIMNGFKHINDEKKDNKCVFDTSYTYGGKLYESELLFDPIIVFYTKNIDHAKHLITQLLLLFPDSTTRHMVFPHHYPRFNFKINNMIYIGVGESTIKYKTIDDACMIGDTSPGMCNPHIECSGTEQTKYIIPDEYKMIKRQCHTASTKDTCQSRNDVPMYVSNHELCKWDENKCVPNDSIYTPNLLLDYQAGEGNMHPITSIEHLYERLELPIPDGIQELKTEYDRIAFRDMYARSNPSAYYNPHRTWSEYVLSGKKTPRKKRSYSKKCKR